MTTSDEKVVDMDRFMTAEDVAEYLSMPLTTVLSWRGRHVGPRGYLIGKRVRYRRGDIDKWVELRADDVRRGGGASEIDEPVGHTDRRT